MEVIVILSVLGTFVVLYLRRNRRKKGSYRPPGAFMELTSPEDLSFAEVAQGARVNQTILPSGYTTPPRDLFIHGKWLTEVRPN